MKKPSHVKKDAICIQGCMHYASKLANPLLGAHFLLMGCRLHKKQFGLIQDVCKNAPTECQEFEKPKYEVLKSWN